jgi:hypothetical protein
LLSYVSLPGVSRAGRRHIAAGTIGAFTSLRRPVRDDLEILYQTTYAAVVRFLYRKVWDADRAEDLAQEVFVRAMAHHPEKPRVRGCSRSRPTSRGMRRAQPCAGNAT